MFTWSAVHPKDRREVGIFKHKCKKIDVKGQVVNDISLFFFSGYFLVTYKNDHKLKTGEV